MNAKKQLLLTFLCLSTWFLVTHTDTNTACLEFTPEHSSAEHYTIYEADFGCKKSNIDCSAIDKKYKEEIISQSDIPDLALSDLDSIMGPCEIEQFIRNNDGNPKIYTPTEDNIKKGIYQANLHTHSTESDGCVPISKRLDEAQKYAELNNMIFYIATTDHNTVNGAKAALKALKTNPNKYKNVKIMLGLEVNSIYNLKDKTKDQVDIHVVVLGINPYDKFLNEEFYKSPDANLWNRPRKNPEFEDFDNVIKVMNNYGIVGVAHPARYIAHLGDKKYSYLAEMLLRYKSLTPQDKPAFTEGYYQSYANNAKVELKTEYENILNFINNKSKAMGIIRNGSLDTHGITIFEK